MEQRTRMMIDPILTADVSRYYPGEMVDKHGKIVHDVKGPWYGVIESVEVYRDTMTLIVRRQGVLGES